MGVMRDRVKKSFEHFCKKGDPKDLARVFDAVAPDLLHSAIHLADDADSAEDLVQATFLTAIDRSE